MAEPHTPTSLTGAEVTVHTAPLPEDGKVLVFVEANAQVTHVISLTAQAARDMVVGLLDALEIADPEGAGGDWWERG